MSNRILLLPALLFLSAFQDVAATSRPAAPEIRTGYVIGRYATPVQVAFQVIDGRGILEGDIDLGPADQVPASREELLARLEAPRGAEAGRLSSAIKDTRYRWPDGVVPYQIMSVPDQQRIHDAMQHVMTRVPTIRFVPWTSEPDLVRFATSSGGCTSAVGRQGGAQYVRLSSICSTGHVVHELGHVLGLWHEQSRCDRDTYVEILTQNIISTSLSQFDKHCPDDPTNAAYDWYSYDEGSIMHYGPREESSNGLPTIRSLRGLDSIMGQRTALSSADANTLATLYPSKVRSCCR